MLCIKSSWLGDVKLQPSFSHIEFFPSICSIFFRHYIQIKHTLSLNNKSLTNKRKKNLQQMLDQSQTLVQSDTTDYNQSLTLLQSNTTD